MGLEQLYMHPATFWPLSVSALHLTSYSLFSCPSLRSSPLSPLLLNLDPLLRFLQLSLLPFPDPFSFPLPSFFSETH